MIGLPLYLAFVGAVVILMLIPGPNVALIVANSVAHGARYGLLTVAGTASAMVVQLCLTGLGMTELLTATGSWFEALRFLGAAYLVFLGIQQWRRPAADLDGVKAEPRSRRAIFGRAFLVSLTNPKTLFFYAAFLPQFIDKNRAAGPQLFILCASCLVVALTIDSLWALLAARLRGFIGRHARWPNRLTGGLLVGAGIGLAARGQ